jgi:deoxyribonuclease V
MKNNTNWKVTPTEAIGMQKELRKQIKLVPLKKKIKFIGGADVSMNLFSTFGFAGFVTLSYPDLELIDHSVAKDDINFPYIPGLLSFREIPMLLRAWGKLKQKPDVVVVDGVGIAHPRRLGIATHLGLVLGVPTIGSAKSVLTGVYKEPGAEAGSISYMYDKYDKKEIIGAAIRTKRNVKPIFVSPGHLITLPEAIEIVQKCIIKHRLPEPTRFAHNTVNMYRVADLENKKPTLFSS